jgi:hypothetical protein
MSQVITCFRCPLGRRPRSEVLSGQRHIWTGFCLEEDTAWLEGNQSVPQPGRQLYRHDVSSGTKSNGSLNLTLIVKNDQGHPPPDSHETLRLGRVAVAMRADVRTWLHGVEQPLAGISIVIMHVEVFTAAF